MTERGFDNISSADMSSYFFFQKKLNSPSLVLVNSFFQVQIEVQAETSERPEINKTGLAESDETINSLNQLLFYSSPIR